MADKVAHILQQEVAGAVEVGEGEVGHDHAILHHAPVAPIEAVHAREALARRSPAEEVHLSWDWNLPDSFRV